MEVFNKDLFLSQQKIFALTHRRVYTLMVNLFQILNQFCSDKNIQTIFGTKFEDFFKLSDRIQFNILNCRNSCEKNIF
jgi:hypothetical protein